MNPARSRAIMNVMKDKVTTDEFFGIFGLRPESVRWLAAADSEEYLGLVTYLAQRSDSWQYR